MKLEELKELIDQAFPEAVLGMNTEDQPGSLSINTMKLHDVCQLLHENERTYFDQLSCLTGVDHGPESGSMEVIYNLYSIPHNLHLMLKVKLDRSDPVIESVTDIWRTADWHEREAFDLLGIKFKNHPDLRRILLPADWQGFPLRKDYVPQETYHNVKVEYE